MQVSNPGYVSYIYAIGSITDVKGSRSNIKAYLYVHSSINTENVLLFPGPPPFSSSVCIQYNTRKWKNGKKWGRAGNTYHVMWR